MKRPQNHVTRAMDAHRLSFSKAGTASVPEVPADLLDYLEALYPPRCYDHSSQSLEDHLVYAGKADLVSFLRAAHEERLGTGHAAEPGDEGDAEALKLADRILRGEA